MLFSCYVMLQSTECQIQAYIIYITVIYSHSSNLVIIKDN